MPYTSQAERNKFRDELDALLAAMGECGCTPGDLNYIISTIGAGYVVAKGLGYTHLNDVMGVFTGAPLEFYRRVVAPYEDHKRRVNGEIYPNALV